MSLRAAHPERMGCSPGAFRRTCIGQVNSPRDLWSPYLKPQGVGQAAAVELGVAQVVLRLVLSGVPVARPPHMVRSRDNFELFVP